MASDTKLGWVVTDTTSLSKYSFSPATNTVTTDIYSIDNTLQTFWQLENFKSDKPILSRKNQQVEAHFAETVSRNSEGRFIVNIPFKQNELHKLGQSKQIATKVFYHWNENW